MSRKEARAQIQPGSSVAIYNRPDVIDGAPATVLDIKGAWLSVQLSRSGAKLMVRPEQVRPRLRQGMPA